MTTARTLPNNLEAEQSVVGGALLHPKLYDAVAGLVTSEDFYHFTHQAIYAAMETLAKAGKPIDQLTVAEQMRLDGSINKLASHGGEKFFSDLTAAVQTVENIGWHAQIVAEKAHARALIFAHEQAAAKLREGEEVDDVQGEFDREVGRGARRTNKRTDWRTLFEIRKDAQRRLEQAQDENAPKMLGIPTGLPALDAVIGGGLQVGDYTCIGGRPSHGKTALGYGLALAAATAKVPSLFVSVEMSEKGIADRDVAGALNVNSNEIRMLRMERENWLRLHNAVKAAIDVPLAVNFRAKTFDDVARTIKRWRRDISRGAGRSDAALVAIDYLQLIRWPARRGERRPERVEQIAEMSDELKRMFAEYDIAGVVLVQLNRDVENRSDHRPQLSDIKGSGSVEQDADLVLFPYRPAVYDPQKYRPEEAEILVAKQRNGEVTNIPAWWDAPRTRYLPMPAEPPPPPEQQSLPGTKPVDFNRKRRGGSRSYHPNAPDSED